MTRMSFVSKIRGTRDVHQLNADEFRAKALQARDADGGDPSFTLQERFDGDTIVKPYYDWDSKYEEALAVC